MVQFVGAVTQNIPMMIVREYHAKVTFPSVPLIALQRGICFFFLGYRLGGALEMVNLSDKRNFSGSSIVNPYLQIHHCSY